MRRRVRTATGSLSAAGWLYAELAMVLVIVAIGSEAPAAPAPPRPAVTTSATPTVKPGSQQGIGLTPVKFVMPVESSDDAVLRTFVSELDRRVGPDGKVGLILLFGTSRNPSAPVQGIRISERVKAIIGGAGIPQLRTIAEIRPYFGGDGTPGSLTVELFLLTGPA
jgi:hypothetical protein